MATSVCILKTIWTFRFNKCIKNMKSKYILNVEKVEQINPVQDNNYQ